MLLNIGAGPYGGAITSACFNELVLLVIIIGHILMWLNFVWLSGAAKGATGRPVPLLMQF